MTYCNLVSVRRCVSSDYLRLLKLNIANNFIPYRRYKLGSFLDTKSDCVFQGLCKEVLCEQLESVCRRVWVAKFTYL